MHTINNRSKSFAEAGTPVRGSGLKRVVGQSIKRQFCETRPATAVHVIKPFETSLPALPNGESHSLRRVQFFEEPKWPE